MLGDDNTPPLDAGSQYLVSVTKSDLILLKCQEYTLAILWFQYNSVMLKFALRSFCQRSLSQIIRTEDNYYKEISKSHKQK